MGYKVITNPSQPAITCSKITTETLEQTRCEICAKLTRKPECIYR